VVIQPKIFTGVKYSFDLDDIIELPLKVCDLAPLSSLAISIFSMDRVEETPIASTVIDLFDSKRRLRQGTWNLMLHTD
jgi:Phosphoinositide 3-kinase C2